MTQSVDEAYEIVGEPIKKCLPCEMTLEEIAERGEELAEFQQRLENLEWKRKSVASQITHLKDESRTAVQEISSGKKDRDVSCIRRFNSDDKIELIRTDTNELVLTREPTSDEKQLRLNLV